MSVPLYTNAIGNEGQVDIELVPAEERNISTNDYIAELRPKVARRSRVEIRRAQP